MISLASVGAWSGCGSTLVQSRLEAGMSRYRFQQDAYIGGLYFTADRFGHRRRWWLAPNRLGAWAVCRSPRHRCRQRLLRRWPQTTDFPIRHSELSGVTAEDLLAIGGNPRFWGDGYSLTGLGIGLPPICT